MNLNAHKKASRRKADRRWTLLFIGDHGNVITLKRFKTIIFAVGFFFLLAIVLLAVLFWGHQKTQQQYSDLQNNLQHAQQQIETLRHEKEILMARLVLAESNAKEETAERHEPNESENAAEPVEPEPQKVAEAEPVPELREESSTPESSKPSAAESQSRETEAIMKVAVENFKVSRESGNKNLMAQFKVKNASRGYPRVDGRAVVLLKGAGLNKNQWLVMPAVEFRGEKPSGKRGKSFSIQRFRTMNFRAKAPNHADQFQTAVVYVFTKNGELLLEQDFAISLPPLPAISSEPPAGDTPNREAQSAEARPRQPTSPQKQPQKAPGGLAPLDDDDVLESLENAPPVF